MSLCVTDILGVTVCVLQNDTAYPGEMVIVLLPEAKPPPPWQPPDSGMTSLDLIGSSLDFVLSKNASKITLLLTIYAYKLLHMGKDIDIKIDIDMDI